MLNGWYCVAILVARIFNLKVRILDKLVFVSKMEKFNISSWTVNGKILHLSLVLKVKKGPMEKMVLMVQTVRMVLTELMVLTGKTD